MMMKCTKFRDPCLNHPWEIPAEAFIGGIFDSFFRYNSWVEVDNDVISGVCVEYVDMDIRVKFCDSRSNGSQDIRGADFVSNEPTKEGTNIT